MDRNIFTMFVECHYVFISFICCCFVFAPKIKTKKSQRNKEENMRKRHIEYWILQRCWKCKTFYSLFFQPSPMECESDDVFMDILSFVLLHSFLFSLNDFFFITSNKNCMNIANDGFLLNYVPLKSEYPLMLLLIFCNELLLLQSNKIQ